MTGAPRSVVLLRGALAVVAGLVAVQAALGLAGRLAWAVPVLAALAASALAVGGAVVGVRARSREREREREREPGARWGGAEWAAGSALAAALASRVHDALDRTSFLYDELSYHLHLPAAWRAAGALAIVPTPFGDPAPAYAPANTELLYHLAMAITGDATLALAGQLPFAALAALAIHAAARVLGTPRWAGLAAALAFLVIPEVWRQAAAAMADLALAASLLAALPFLLRLEARRSWPDVVGLGLALGLGLGTKYVALVLAAPLGLWAAVVLLRYRPPPEVRPARAAAAAAALVLGCGGFWYLRNFAVTGNPLYPLALAVGPFPLAPGLYDGEAMRRWEYHLPVTDLGALGEMLAGAGWGFGAAAIAAAVVTRRARWPALVALVVALGWLVIPYQQSRFLFSAFGLGAVMLAAAAGAAPHAGAAALVLAVAASVLQFPTPGRLAVLGAAGAGAGVAYALGVARARWRWRRLRRGGATVTALAAALGVTAAAGVAVAVLRARGRPPPVYAVGDDHDAGWAWIRAHAGGRRIAYTGSNLPFPLWGARLENDVRYVNVVDAPGALLHHFVGALDVAAPAAAVTAEPAPYREAADQATWLANLETLRIEILFVAALYPVVRRVVAHDGDGFPDERAWADARPGRFRLVFANDGVRIYAVSAASAGSAGR